MLAYQVLQAKQSLQIFSAQQVLVLFLQRKVPLPRGFLQKVLSTSNYPNV